MAEVFDPYHKWLAIPPEEQPPNHYRLLGLRAFEDDLDVIESAADRQMGHIRRFASGQRSELSQKLLNEISAAKVNLLNPAKRQAYDAGLKAQLQAQAAAKAAALPKAQALPTAKALPTAQALPMAQPLADTAARTANPQLRTRGEQSSPAGMDIPVVGPSGGVKRRKRKSSPVAALVFLAVAAVGLSVGAFLVLRDRGKTDGADVAQGSAPQQNTIGVTQLALRASFLPETAWGWIKWVVLDLSQTTRKRPTA